MPDEYFELKANLHNRLLDLLDLSMIEKLDRQTIAAQVRKIIEKILRKRVLSSRST